MQLHLHHGPDALAHASASLAADTLRRALHRHGEATLVAATGMTQIALLAGLARACGIDWPRVTVFHLDEYLGLPQDHPASFRRYLRERFLSLLPAAPAFVPVAADAADPQAECRRLDALMSGRRIDLCLAGVGDNGHLAFNEPPADFATTASYHRVPLAAASRRQQAGQGWFAQEQDVPVEALSMTVPQMLLSHRLLLTATGAHKQQAVRAMVEGPIDPQCPASAVQRHADCHVFLDPAAAAGLQRPPSACG